MSEPRCMLGKLDPHPTPAGPKMASFVDLNQLTYPRTCNWSQNVRDYPLFGNDRIGLCTVAAALHGDITWTTNVCGVAYAFSEEEAIEAYGDITAAQGNRFDPRTGKNDTGCVEEHTLAYWKKNGIGSRKIRGWADGSPQNMGLTKFIISKLGYAYVGIRLPLTAKGQFERNQEWGVYPKSSPFAAPGSWGGHAMILTGYNENAFWGPTWQKVQRMTQLFLWTYCDEVHAPVGDDWLDVMTETSPSDLDLPGLMKAVSAVGLFH